MLNKNNLTNTKNIPIPGASFTRHNSLDIIRERGTSEEDDD